MFDEPTVAPVAVDDGNLRVQERPVIFLDTDAGGEQLAVQRARRVVQQPILDARLQQQRDANAALRRGDQRAAEADAGKEVGIGDQDLLLRGADRGEVGALDVAAVAQVVADHEFRGLRRPLRGDLGDSETAARRSAGTAPAR